VVITPHDFSIVIWGKFPVILIPVHIVVF